MKAFSDVNINSIYISATSNNTIISLVNFEGVLLFTLSCGHLQYKGSKKSSQIASRQTISFLAKKVISYGYKKILIKVKGIGKGRRFAIKELKKAGLHLERVFDITSIPYNGCRVKKCKK